MDTKIFTANIQVPDQVYILLPGKQELPKLTIAQSIRRSSDPYRASITSFSRREVIRSEDGKKDKKIFHFEDASFLTFEVSYLAVEDGGGQ